MNPLPFITGASDFLSNTYSRLTSTAFAPHFPGAFTISSDRTNGCLDLHPIVTGFNAFCLVITTLFLSPSPCILFSVLVILGYLQIMLFSDPPSVPPDWSAILGGLLPVLFTSYWIYHTSFKRTLYGFTSLPFDVMWWQGAGFWIGIESYTIFAKLPIQTLGYGGLSNAGVVTITLIAIVAAIVVGVQAWQMRKAGLLQYYLLRYTNLSFIRLALTNCQILSPRPDHDHPSQYPKLHSPTPSLPLHARRPSRPQPAEPRLAVRSGVRPRTLPRWGRTLGMGQYSAGHSFRTFFI